MQARLGSKATQRGGRDGKCSYNNLKDRRQQQRRDPAKTGIWSFVLFETRSQLHSSGCLCDPPVSASGLLPLSKSSDLRPQKYPQFRKSLYRESQWSREEMAQWVNKGACYQLCCLIPRTHRVKGKGSNSPK